jgi:putative chitinase
MTQISKNLLVKSGTCNEITADIWIDALNVTCAKYEINTPERIAGFLSQVSHESSGFKFVEENLNYSAPALRTIFGKYFTDDSQANAYSRHPEKIANKVYAKRMGNSDEASGDGWKYRGRGLIQLTGKDNYTACGKALGVDFVSNPDLVASPDFASLSAGWFWFTRNLNNYADAKDIIGMTKRINGGTNGLNDRQMKYAKLMDYFNRAG